MIKNLLNEIEFCEDEETITIVSAKYRVPISGRVFFVKIKGGVISSIVAEPKEDTKFIESFRKEIESLIPRMKSCKF